MKLHLGCGSNYLNGWINIDVDSELADVKRDLREPLPYADASIDIIFNEHFIEHISPAEALGLLRECHRVLKPGGILRISTPNLEWVVAMYANNKLDEWHDIDWNPTSRCRLLNEAMRSWGHQFLYDLEEISNVLREAGFNRIEEASWRNSNIPDLSGLECRPYHREIILEASA